MTHLAPDSLFAAIFDQAPLPADADSHLAQSALCRRTYADLVELVDELKVARAAEVTLAAADRYAALFSHVQPLPGPITALWRRFIGQLAWDSRQQPALQGVRSAAAATNYRLLFAGETGEVELLVEREGHLFRVQGEWVAHTGAEQGPFLVQWFTADGVLLYEVETGADGQFALRNLAPGHYRLSIMAPSGDSTEIEALEIA